MQTYYPIYQKKIDYETGEAILDANGCFIMEHVSDLIVQIPDSPVYRDPTPEELEEIRLLALEQEKFRLEFLSTIE